MIILLDFFLWKLMTSVKKTLQTIFESKSKSKAKAKNMRKWRLSKNGIRFAIGVQEAEKTTKNKKIQKRKNFQQSFARM